jgi:hypothetical protein
MGEERKLYKVFVGSLKERDHLEDSRNRWEDEIRMDLREISCWEECSVDSVGS